MVLRSLAPLILQVSYSYFFQRFPYCLLALGLSYLVWSSCIHVDISRHFVSLLGIVFFASGVLSFGAGLDFE